MGHKSRKQSVFHRNLGGAWGGIDSRHPYTYENGSDSQKEPEPFIYPMERATGIEPASSAWKCCDYSYQAVYLRKHGRSTCCFSVYCV